MAELKPITETCSPRADVLAGGLSDNHFAAQLDQVVRNPEAYPVYGDPTEFFALTYPTAGLRDLLTRTFGRLSGAKVPGAEHGLIRSETSFGGGTDDDLKGELARRETRLAKIRRAKADLEQDARDKAAKKAADRARDKGADEEAVDKATEQAAGEAVPEDKAQRNFTDPESRIMKTNDGSFHYCYNAQAVVDDANQVIVATRLNNSATDSQSFPEMLDQVIDNCGEAPHQVLADAGYFSNDNVEAAMTRGINPLVATGRLHHDEAVPSSPKGRIPKDATPKQRMARKLRTKAGKSSYARRKAIVEPVFGQMDVVQGAKFLLLRGEELADAEWQLLSACHNLRKLFVVKGSPRVACT